MKLQARAKRDAFVGRFVPIPTGRDRERRGKEKDESELGAAEGRASRNAAHHYFDQSTPRAAPRRATSDAESRERSVVASNTRRRIDTRRSLKIMKNASASLAYPRPPLIPRIINHMFLRRSLPCPAPRTPFLPTPPTLRLFRSTQQVIRPASLTTSSPISPRKPMFGKHLSSSTVPPTLPPPATTPSRPKWSEHPPWTRQWYIDVGIICTVFAITGSSAVRIVHPVIVNVFGVDGGFLAGPWLYRGLYIMTTLPTYSLILVTVGTLLGRGAFFQAQASRMWKRFLPRKWR
ncbi:hypothetical protein BDK51DRAFT_51754 [Blyttiomyces helicus]|uniref:DUF6787 domain-containing protein n=1 Tax=Blyttiomyces helicus TaxID=388810 RepID=A0A4P9WK33_9FUNG|nr:hypothetical protein BDK51DRAFT_51754 [Blyttiomyces helicus]|eukprot:RKO93154.1 hypothetical protein BDK51DRAFT_51754 [Blyttiomyces helicus]